MEWETVLSTLFGTVVGGLVSLLVARHYHRKATDELRDKTDELLNALVTVSNNPGAILERIPGRDGRPGSLAVGSRMGAPGTGAATSETPRRK